MIPASYAPREPPPESTKPIRGRFRGACTSLIVRATRRRRRCPRGMKRTFAVTAVMGAISALLAPAARADPADEATEYTVGGLAQAMHDVQVAECTIQITLNGAVAEVETRERWINHADRALAVRERLAVPAGG